MNVDSSNILLPLLSNLKCLRWLDLGAAQVDADVLAAVNSHPSLTTVAVRDTCLRTLQKLVSSTALPFSKILVPMAELNSLFTLQSPVLHSLMGRCPRLAHLILRDMRNIKNGPGTLFFPGLEELEVGVFCGATALMSWLPAFVEQHATLGTIKFIGDKRGSSWRKNPDILFPLQFSDALERESLSRTAGLYAFSISRMGTSSALDDWPVVQLEVTILKATGIAALNIASSLAPQTSSLRLRMSRWGKEAITIDDFIPLLPRFSSLQKLDLRGMYRHLIFEGPARSVLPSSNAVRKSSGCFAAHAALRWLVARAAEFVLSLHFIHITDEGDDLRGRSTLFPWKLEVTYRVLWNRELEAIGTPQLVMDDLFCVPPQS
ncbi:hypothetical protein B0H11DRAFT_2005847 [Mycena galericulata]|nr:hypothetical protein B0H11DRAFT_2005847 [Mycena galericulata]